MEDVFDTLEAVTARVSDMHARTDLGGMTGEQVTSFVRLAGRLRQEVDRVLAVGAAEINQRSRRELGNAGLARAEGHGNSQTMIATLIGSSTAEARKLDRLGRSLMESGSAWPAPDIQGQPLNGSDDPDGPDGAEVSGVEAAGCAGGGGGARPWFADITDLMRSGEVSPDRFEALRAGLGDETEMVPGEALQAAAARILDLLHPEDLPETVFRDARQARALLDRAGVADEEDRHRAAQQARIWASRDGMVHLRADFAAEDGTWVKNTLDLLLGPRIGGPRLITGTAAEHAQIIENDPRTIDQIRAATIVSLLKAGVQADDNAVLARRRPAVQIVVTAAELTRPHEDGVAFITGTNFPVTMNTVSRLICDTGYVPVILSPDGSPLDLGREVRLFTQKQRVVISTLQGGCVWPGCEKPPPMCELHHIEHWAQGGKTDIKDGVLLCRYHHMLLHNNGWQIIRNRQRGRRYEDSYQLVPPRSHDPDQTPQTLRFRSPTQHLGSPPAPHDSSAQALG
jgi:hypothetical protein